MRVLPALLSISLNKRAKKPKKRRVGYVWGGFATAPSVKKGTCFRVNFLSPVQFAATGNGKRCFLRDDFVGKRTFLRCFFIGKCENHVEIR